MIFEIVSIQYLPKQQFATKELVICRRSVAFNCSTVLVILTYISLLFFPIISTANMGRHVLLLCVVSVAIFISTNARPLTDFEEKEILNAVRNVLKDDMTNTLDTLQDTSRNWDIGNSRK